MVKLQRGYLGIYVKNKNDLKQNLVYEWYYEKALLHFFNILHEFNKIVRQDGEAVTPINHISILIFSLSKSQRYAYNM